MRACVRTVPCPCPCPCCGYTACACVRACVRARMCAYVCSCRAWLVPVFSSHRSSGVGPNVIDTAWHISYGILVTRCVCMCVCATGRTISWRTRRRPARPARTARSACTHTRMHTRTPARTHARTYKRGPHQSVERREHPSRRGPVCTAPRTIPTPRTARHTPHTCAYSNAKESMRGA